MLVKGAGSFEKRGAIGLTDDEIGYFDDEDEGKDIGQDIENIFTPEVEAGYKKVEVGVEDAKHQHVSDDIALGRRVGQIGMEA
jgi:hypothetical protein